MKLSLVLASDCRSRYSWEFLVGVCRPAHHTFIQTRPLKSIPVFRPGLQAEIMLSLLRLERKQKNSSKPFRIRVFFFLSYSFGIETIKTFIQSRSSLKNHTRFQTKRGKVYTFFQTKTTQLCPIGRHSYITYIWEYPPPPGSRLPTSFNMSYVCLKIQRPSTKNVFRFNT